MKPRRLKLRGEVSCWWAWHNDWRPNLRLGHVATELRSNFVWARCTLYYQTMTHICRTSRCRSSGWCLCILFLNFEKIAQIWVWKTLQQDLSGSVIYHAGNVRLVNLEKVLLDVAVLLIEFFLPARRPEHISAVSKKVLRELLFGWEWLLFASRNRNSYD